jgi:fatty acid desaturase
MDNINLEKWYRPKIDHATIKQLSVRSDWVGIRHILIYFVALLASGVMVYLTWGTGWTVLWLLIYGNIWAFSNAIQHETNHKSFFKSPKLNLIFWHISSFMTAFEPIRWKWTHFVHHSSTMHTTSPYDFEIQVTRPADVFAFFLKFIPFGGLLILHKSLHYVHVETIKHALGIKTPVLLQSVPVAEQPKAIFWARVHVGLWLLTILASVLLQSWLPVLFIILPNFYGGTLLTLCGLTQHSGLAENERDHRLSTRTVILNPVLSFLYCHMEYHIEHHIFPAVPCHNLSQLHEAVKNQMPAPCIGLIGAYKEIIPAVIKQSRDADHFIQVQLPA